MSAPSTPAQTEPAIPPLCRVALFVGENTEIDYTVPAQVPLIAVIEDLLSRVNTVLEQRGRAPLDSERSYQLCWPDGRPLDPQKTLAEHAVFDGDELWLLPIEQGEHFEPVIENVSTAIATAARRELAIVTPTVARAVACWLTAFIVAWSELIVARWWLLSGGTDTAWGWLPAAGSWALAAALALTARGLSRAQHELRRQACDAVAWTATIAVGAAAAMSVLGTPGWWHIGVAIAAVMTWAALVTAITGRHVMATTALLTSGVFGLSAAIVAASGWDVRPERVAVVALAVVVVAVTWSTNMGVAASGVPAPLFPSATNRGFFERSAGLPADTVAPVGPTGVVSGEQIVHWARRGNDVMSGLLLGLAAVTVVACRYGVVPGQPGAWRYTAFVVAVCAVLALRARSYVDRTQSVTLVCTAVAGLAMVVGRYATAADSGLATALVCAGITAVLAVVVLGGALVVPTHEFSTPVRKFVEISEYLLLLVMGPWLVWLLALFPLIRNAIRPGQ